MNNCTVCGNKLTTTGLITYCANCNSNTPDKWNLHNGWLWRLLQYGVSIPDDATHAWWEDGEGPGKIIDHHKPWSFDLFPSVKTGRNKGAINLQRPIYIFKINE